jgi:hypothetical protein
VVWLEPLYKLRRYESKAADPTLHDGRAKEGNGRTHQWQYFAYRAAKPRMLKSTTWETVPLATAFFSDGS